MSRQPLSRERICEALESCRPGSSDLSAADFADVAGHVANNSRWEEVYERIQHADLKIAAAFHDVEIPPGLEQRLIASLELAQAEDALSLALSGEADIVAPSDLSATHSSKKDRAVSRRWFIVAGGILTTAAALFLVVYLGMNNTAKYSPQTVLDKAFNYFKTDNSAAPGQLHAKVPAPSNFPLSKNIRSFSGIRWRTVDKFMGRSGVAFDLPAQGGVRATLYVVACTIPDLGVSPTTTPSNTGGCCVAAWQEGGLVYVLVVQGSQKSYMEYLYPSGPMA